MRKITQQTVNALFSNGNMVNNNTVVSGGVVYLHGNMIARLQGTKLQVSFCGWVTPTTRDRINAIVSHATNGKIKVGIRKGEPELRHDNGYNQIIDSCDWYTVDTLKY